MVKVMPNFKKKPANEPAQFKMSDGELAPTSATELPSGVTATDVRRHMVQDAMRMLRDGLDYHESRIPQGSMGVQTIVAHKKSINEIEAFFLKEVLPKAPGA